jgi:hypothetical protein
VFLCFASAAGRFLFEGGDIEGGHFLFEGGGIEQTFAKEFSFVAAGEREHYELTEKRKERTLWSFSTIMTWLTSEKSHK